MENPSSAYDPYPDIPELLPERQELIKQIDGLCKEWSERGSGANTLIRFVPITELVINDCTHVNHEAVRKRMEAPEYEKDLRQRELLRRAMTRSEKVARYTSDERYDAIEVTDPEYRTSFKDHLAWGEDVPGAEPYAQAVLYMRRIFTIREQLARLNGVQNFNTEYIDRVMEEIVDDEDARRRSQSSL